MNHIKNRLGDKYGMVVSDVTGQFPGDAGNPERLAFLFKWPRIARTELSSDITYDRSKVVETLFTDRALFQEGWEKHIEKIGAWLERVRVAKKQKKKRAPSKPAIVLSSFLTFIRQPHCASFRVLPRSGGKSIDFLAVNAHLLYGTNADERRWEFEALIEWLTLRAKKADTMYYKNIILLGDCNLEFKDVDAKRDAIEQQLKDLNKKKLSGKKAAEVNFPLLDEHPKYGLIRTNARQNQTYDQIAIFSHDKRLPRYKKNKVAGTPEAKGYDYGVFRFTDLIGDALYGSSFKDLLKPKQDYIYKRSRNEISDHMPAWIRLAVPK
jgi:hypothetical protein